MKIETIEKANELISRISRLKKTLIDISEKNRDGCDRIRLSAFNGSSSHIMIDNFNAKNYDSEFNIFSDWIQDEMENFIERLRGKYEKEIKKLEKELENLKD